MEIVIKIPDRLIKKAKDHYVNPYEVDEICEAILDGTPLPEHCGRLIAANSLIKAIEEKAKQLSNTDTINGLCGAVALIFDEPTIIEGSEIE